MASIGPNSVSVQANNTSIGTFAWAEGGVGQTVFTSNDEGWVTATIGAPLTTNRLIARAPGFSVPAGSTIDGIEVLVEGMRDVVSATSTFNVKLWNGTSTTADNSIGTGKTYTPSTSPSETVVTLGSSTDGWGASLTDAIVNGTGFGVALWLAETAATTVIWQIDHVQIKVYYTLPPAIANVPTASLTFTGYVPSVWLGGYGFENTAFETTAFYTEPTSSSVNIAVPVGNLTFTGYAPTVSVGSPVNIAVPSAGLTLTGNAPTVSVSNHKTISVPTASLTFAAYVPTVSISDNKVVNTPVASLSFTAYAPTVSVSDNKTISVPTAGLTFTAYAPTVLTPRTIAVPVVNLVFKAGGSQNLILNSETFTTLLSSAGITNNVITAPDGATTGSLLTLNSGVTFDMNNGAGMLMRPSTGAPIQPFTYSVYAKAGPTITKMLFRNNYTGNNALFDLAAGTVTQGSGVSTITSVGSGWYRCSCLYTPNGTGNNGISARPYVSGGTSNGVDGIYIWGTQVENGPITPYVKTTSSVIQNSDPNLVQISDHKTVSVPTAGLTFTAYAPTVIASGSTTVQVPLASLSVTAHAPTVSVSDNKTVNVPTAGLTVTAYAPIVYTPRTVNVPTAALTFTAYAPTITISDHKVVNVPNTALSFTVHAPTVLTPRTVNVPVGSMSFTAFAPTVVVTDHKTVNVPTAELQFTAYAPTVLTPTVISVPTASLLFTVFTPNVIISKYESFIYIRDVYLDGVNVNEVFIGNHIHEVELEGAVSNDVFIDNHINEVEIENFVTDVFI